MSNPVEWWAIYGDELAACQGRGEILSAGHRRHYNDRAEIVGRSAWVTVRTTEQAERWAATLPGIVTAAATDTGIRVTGWS